MTPLWYFPIDIVVAIVTAAVLAFTLWKLWDYTKATKSMAEDTTRLAESNKELIEIMRDERREARINRVIDKTMNGLAGREEQVLFFLSRAGILHLNESEIKETLYKVQNIFGKHPFKDQKELVEKKGYRCFFEKALENGVKDLSMPVVHSILDNWDK